MRLGKVKITIRIPELVLALCLFRVVTAGHSGLDGLSSLVRYAMMGLIVLDIFFNGLKISRDLLIFYCVTLIAGVANTVYNTFVSGDHFQVGSALSALLYYCFYAYCGFYIALRLEDKDKLYRWIHAVTMVGAGIILTQYVLRMVLGIRLSAIPVIGEYIFHAVDRGVNFRPSGIFSEPSQFAKIAVLDLYFSLFVKNNRRATVVVLLGVLCSTSGMGIILSFGLLVWWAVSCELSKKQWLNVALKLALVLAFVALVVFFFGYSGDNRLLNRLRGGATINQRTFRAVEVYYKMQPLDKIFGVGLYNMANYLDEYGIVLVTDRADTLVHREYGQSFVYVLCTLGIAGFAGYAGLILNFALRLPKKKKIVAAILLGVSLTASIMVTAYFALILAVCYGVLLDEDAFQPKLTE